jgi:hypothetical protein
LRSTGLGLTALSLEFIINLRQIAEGVKAFKARSQSSLVISLCHRITRPLVLYLRALHVVLYPLSHHGDGEDPPRDWA